MDHVRIPVSRNGPPDSGHGGYSAGLFATAVADAAAVRVRLHLPPPLEVAISVEQGTDLVRFRHGDEMVAEAAVGALSNPDLPERPSLAAAAEAGRRSAFRTQEVDHPFPTCFGCGTQRPPGDGLQIWPGLASSGAVAAAVWDPAPWVDDGRLSPVLQWAALDCPGALGAMEQLGLTLGQQTWLLGTMTAEVTADWAPTAPVSVLGWLQSHEGRKHLVGSALVGADGDLVARAEAIWIRVDS